MITADFFNQHTYLPLLNHRWQSLTQLRTTWFQMVVETWETLMPLEYVHLALGLVFGVDLEKGSELQSSIKIIGMSHVTSASGYNVGLILNLAHSITSRFYRLYRLATLFPLVWVYVWLCDFTPSVTRAALMSSLMLLAASGRRQLSAMRALCYTAVLVAIFKTDWLGSLSFQLSWFATLGIVAWLPLTDVERWLGMKSWERTQSQADVARVGWRWWWCEFRQNWLATLCTQLTTGPLIFEHFQNWPVVALLANPLLLWLTPAMTLLSGGYLVVTTAAQPILGHLLGDPVWGWWLGWPLRTTMDVFRWGAEGLARLPGSNLVVADWPTWQTYGWWGCLYLVWLWRGRVAQGRHRIIVPYV